MLIKPLDFGIILPALALTAASFFYAYNSAPGQAGITVKGEKGEWVFPPDSDETISVSGPLGETIIEIHNNSARFISSPCANQTCVSSGAINSRGQWAACLPNSVMMVIGNEKPGRAGATDDVDASSW